jgi:hypothetical protein
MGTSVALPFAQLPVPAHIQQAIDAGVENIGDKNTVNQLSFRGKVWRQVIDGEEQALVNKDDEPVSTVHVVVLNHNKARSRSFYEGAYEEGKSKPPACWSNDGEVPDSDVKEPVSPSCASCPNAVKGSKITPNGKETTACSVYKRLAVVPLSNLECPPLLLRLAQTSMWDKNNEENEKKGYYAWDQYLDMLRNRGAKHTGYVATKIRFDSRMAYPKLVFAASRWLSDEELETVKPLFESAETLALLNASEIAAATRKPATKADDTDDEEAPPAAKPGKPKKAALPPVEEPEAEDEEEAAPPPPPKKGTKKAAPPPVEEEEPEAEDEEEAAPPPPPKKGAKKAAPPPVEEDEPEVEDDEEAAPPPPPKKGSKGVDMAAVKARVPERVVVGKAAPAKKGNDGLADLVEEFDD